MKKLTKKNKFILCVLVILSIITSVIIVIKQEEADCEFMGIYAENCDYTYSNRYVKVVYYQQNNEFSIILKKNRFNSSVLNTVNCRIGFYEDYRDLVDSDVYVFKLDGPGKAVYQSKYSDPNLESLIKRSGYVKIIIPLSDKDLTVKIPCKPNKKDVRAKRMKELAYKIGG